MPVSSAQELLYLLLRWRFLLAATVVIFSGHIFAIAFLGPTPRGIFLSNLMQFAASLLAFAYSLDASRRARGIARPFWAMVSATFLLWTVAQADWIHHVTWASGRVPRVSLSNILFRFHTAPLMLMLVMDERRDDRRTDWSRILDVVQVGIVIFLTYLVIDFGAGIRLQMMNSLVLDVVYGVNPINVAIAVAALARSRAVRSPVLQKLWSRISVYLLAYAPMAGIANYMAGVWDPVPASAWDLAYTTPLLVGAAVAATWQEERDAVSATRLPQKESRVGLVFYSLLPLLVITLGLLVAAGYRWMALIAVVLSMACYGARLMITQLKQEESFAALRTSEERYRTLFENNLAGVFRSTQEGRFLDCNEAFARMLGYRREEILRMNAAELWPTPAARADRLQLLRERGSVMNVESAFRRKDGALILALQNIVLRQGSDGGEVVEGTILDLTEKKLLEQQLFQAQKMEAVGRLAGGVAHDFNNLLSVILGYSDFLVEALAGDKINRARAEGIRGAGERAAALTRQLLAFSRQQVLDPRVLDLRRSVTEMQSLLRRLIGEHIELVMLLGEGPALVKADPSQIEQVIMNLAVNARDAMPDGGKLTIEIDSIRVDDEQARKHAGFTPGDYVLLALTDTGQGMDSKTQARIFEPFFTTKEKGKGTGLGLATVFGIVQQSEGHIWLYSEPGRGTTFKVYLPRAVPELPLELPPREAARPTGGSETVLVVEDETSLRELTTEYLQHGGYTVRAARSGEEALELATQNPGRLHLLLTDVVLPGISGRVLAERLVAQRPELKVLYVSGYTDDTIVHHGVLNAGLAFLQKPFSRDSLLRKVRATLDDGQPS